jgi:hypothetical protein
MSRASAILRIVAAVCIVILGTTGTSGAQGNRPRTEPVSGTFAASPDNVMQRFCQGEDGQYLEIRGRFEGTIASSDPRLTGVLEFMAEPALVNLTTGFGTFQGPFSIRDAAGGRQKARGEFHNVVTNVILNHGFALGKVTNQESGPSDDFFAQFKATFDPATFNVTGQFGGTTADPRTPAVIQGGHCSGPFIPAP